MKSFFEPLWKILFGEKVYFHDSILGTFDTRVKHKKPTKEFIWSSSHKILGQKRETFFFLDGNYKQPHKSILESVNKVMSQQVEIRQKLDVRLSLSEDYPKILNWKSTFVLTEISSYKNNFEVIFEPVDYKDDRMVSCLWTNGALSEIEIFAE